MADYQRVIEFLRDVRQGGMGMGGMQAATEEVAHMAKEYADICTQANERLRQCSALLQQGLRSEAIHLAEQTPNLLDLVSQLDLPDPQVWAEFCQNNNLPVPPPPQFERASQLNEAYAQEQPLEHLLARQRLLALSRAPIRARLEIMRKIAAVDSGSTHWDKDLREFERARLKELPSEFYNAVKKHDNQTLTALMEEVNRQPWLEAPPVELGTAVAEAFARLQRTAVEAQLQKLVEPLRDAFAARSLQECQALVQRWKNIMASASVTSVSPELMDEIKPVAIFVTEQTKRDEYLKKFNDACKAFGKLLDMDATDTQLEAGYARLKEYKEEVSEDLIRRYMNKKAGRRKDADRKHKVRLMMIGGAAVAVIAVGLIGARIYTNGENAGEWATKIEAAVNKHTKEGIDEAQKNVDQLKQTNAGLLNESKILTAVNKFQAEKSQYDRDQQSIKALDAHLTTARQAAETLLANNAAPIEELRARGDDLDAALKESNAVSGSLAWADADKSLTQQVASATSTWKTMQERVLIVFRKELQAIDADLELVPRSASNSDAAAQTRGQLATLESRAEALRSTPLLDDDARTSLTALTTRIAERRQGALATGDVAAELERVRGSASSADTLKGALDAFIAKYATDPRAADFKTALEGIPAAQSLEAWERFASDFKDMSATGGAAAEKRATDIEGFITAHPDCPKTADATAYADYLHHAAAALADKGTWQNAFADLLTNPLLTELQIMQVSDGRRYYTLGDAKRTDHRFNNSVSVSFETIEPAAFETADAGEVAKAITKRLTITVDSPLTVADKPIPAEHTKVMGEIADDLKTLNETNWDTFGIDLADHIIANPQMDLVVKAILLQQVLKAEQSVAGGTYGVGDVYARTLADLSRQNPSELFWFDPPKISEGTKKALTQIISAIPPGRLVKPQLAAARSVLFKAAAAGVNMGAHGMTSGVVMKDDAGTWEVFTQAPPDTGTAVWAIVSEGNLPAAAPGPRAPTSLLQVGTAPGGKFVLNADDMKKLPQGTIVYISRP